MPLRHGCGVVRYSTTPCHAHRTDTSCPCKGASRPRKGEDEREGADPHSGLTKQGVGVLVWREKAIALFGALLRETLAERPIFSLRPLAAP